MNQEENVDNGVMNFQIQYFPRAAKIKLDEMAERNKMTKKELLILIAANAGEIEEFLKKKRILQ